MTETLANVFFKIKKILKKLIKTYWNFVSRDWRTSY